jgi:hypothetical protein
MMGSKQLLEENVRYVQSHGTVSVNYADYFIAFYAKNMYNAKDEILQMAYKDMLEHWVEVSNRIKKKAV